MSTRTRLIAGALLSLVAVTALRAQQPTGDQKPDAPSAAQSGSQKEKNPATIVDAKPIHRFWDTENDILFGAVGVGRGLDYASTLNLRRRGINEALLTNSIVDNHALFTGIEVGATAASIGVSYLFHRTGHHRLERWTSAIHFGVATGGAIRNYALKTPH